jgi:putative endonuclease
VKARPTEEEALMALRPRQRERIRAAADLWRMTHPRHADCDVRFDMVLVSPGRWPRHIRGAFD